MKILLLIALLAAPVYSATNAEIEAQIAELQQTLQKQVADSTVAVLNAVIEDDSDYATLKDIGVTIINQAHQNGNYDEMWVGVDFPLSTATSADSVKINLALGILKAQHKAQDCGVAGRVRLHKNRLDEANETLKLIFD